MGGTVDFYLHGEREFYSNKSRVSDARVLSMHIFMKHKTAWRNVGTEPRTQDLVGKQARAPFLHVNP